MPKISEYTDTTPVLTDEVLGTDDPGGTPGTVTFILSAIKSLFSETSNSTDEETGTTYTFVLGDAGLTKEFNNASTITVTIPANTSVAYDVGTIIFLRQTGAGQVVIDDANVTLNSYNSADRLEGQWAEAYLEKTATDTWFFGGQITTA